MSSNSATSEPFGGSEDSTALRHTSDTMTIDWSPEELELAEDVDSIEKSGRVAIALSAAWAAIARGIRTSLASVRRDRRKPIMIAAAIVVALVAALAGTATAMAKTVTISVDGVSRHVTTLSGTVNGALNSAGIKVGAHDSLAPAGNSDISDGSQISLGRGRTFTAIVDGTRHTMWTTSTTVSAALSEIGEHASDLDLSVPAGAAIPLNGLAVTGATLHNVTLSVEPTALAPQAAVRAATPATSAATPAASASEKTSAVERSAPKTFAATQARPKAEPVEYRTSAATVGDFLDQQDLAVAKNQEVTPPLATPIADNTAISIVTVPTVSLVVGGKQPATVYTDAGTVGAMLADTGVTLATHDTVTPSVESVVTDGMTVAVTTVSYKTTTSTQAVKQPADQQKGDPTMAIGATKTVTEGHPGEVTVYFHTKIENGVAVGDPVEVSRKTVTPATASVVHIGTMAPATSPATASSAPTPAGANGVNWDGIAQCESGQRWNINTGNGYYGGLQFDIRTWLGNGGGRFAPRADLATKAQQIEIANYVYAHRGLQPWGCRAYG